MEPNRRGSRASADASMLDIRICLCHLASVERLLTALRATAEPTRLRLLALAARGAFCVMDFTEILGQSQPRLSRHLRLLCEAGLLERVREGANVWFALPTGREGALVRSLARADFRRGPGARFRPSSCRPGALERARAASESFRRQGADWDEMRALGLPAQAVEDALLALIPDRGIERLLDIGTGTGRLLELLAPRVCQALGVDASKGMLALARARLGRAGLSHCAVRLATCTGCRCRTRHSMWPCCKWCCTTPRTLPPCSRKPRACCVRAAP